ncbi:MAG: hypothetical protein JWQ62_1472 [Lacunisphaera sp.]|nr:hypothetical protein [Lacunisphaera sp.]
MLGIEKMKPLQIALFLIANVIFITQSGHHLHQLAFGAEPSVLDRFDTEKSKARSETQLQVLLDDYKTVSDEIRALEKGKKQSEAADVRQEHSDLYEKKDALQIEISDRERKGKELRDLWIFSSFGLGLILLGGTIYRRGIIWPGFSILVTGFCILEYWSSPTIFGGGALAEFHQLLLSKTILTFAALVALYLFWRIRETANPPIGFTARR